VQRLPPQARFALTALLIVAGLLSFWASDVFGAVQQASLRLSTDVAALLLSLLGENASAEGKNLVSERFAVRIGQGCDALPPLLVFAGVVLASPVRLLPRAIGLLGGSVVLLALNQVRIISLYYIGIYWPDGFDMMHREVWQVLFIALMVGTYLAWAVWARTERSPAH
jgi:exosortase/archaeosortase family protein